MGLPLWLRVVFCLAVISSWWFPPIGVSYASAGTYRGAYGDQWDRPGSIYLIIWWPWVLFAAASWSGLGWQAAGCAWMEAESGYPWVRYLLANCPLDGPPTIPPTLGSSIRSGGFEFPAWRTVRLSKIYTLGMGNCNEYPARA